MRKLLIFIIMISFATAASAQFSIGVKGGVNANFNSWRFNSIVQGFDITKSGNSAGFHVGAQLRFVIPVVGLYFQSDVLYDQASKRLDYSGADISKNSIKIKNHSLDIPVVVGFKVAFFRIYAGPKFGISLGNEVTKSLEDTNNIVYKYNSNAFGYQAGIGFDIAKRVTIDLNYNGRFYGSTQSFSVNGSSINGKLSDGQLWISVGFLFKKSGKK